MSTQEVSAEQFAQLFHRYHQALENEPECANDPAFAPWNEVPEEKRTRMVDATRLALQEIEVIGRQEQKREDNHFAKPGEAEWGC